MAIYIEKEITKTSSGDSINKIKKIKGTNGNSLNICDFSHSYIKICIYFCCISKNNIYNFSIYF